MSCKSASRPARGAWIEIPTWRTRRRPSRPSRPARGAWIEIMLTLTFLLIAWLSRPARGAWIEIYRCCCYYWFGSVAPRTGRVD